MPPPTANANSVVKFSPSQNTMRSYLIKIVVLPLVLFLAACESDDLTNPSPGDSSSLIGYDLGVSKGRADGSGGLSRTPDRYSSMYSEADRSEFFRGYEDGYNKGIRQPGTPGGPPSSGQPLSARVGNGKVTILEGSRTVSVCTTALPNVEETKFISEQQQIVVKSRGAHGPATVQLFDTATGSQKSSVAAYNIRGGNPSWADGMGE